MKHLLLIYDVSPDYLTRRAQFRQEHLAKAWAAADRGELLLGGALTDPADTAILLFAAESPEVVHAFVREDPYVANGLVRQWRVREWTTVVGPGAATPLRAG
ncbi:MAG: YciI-like protein [Anaeromyxobacter sp.]